MNIALIAHDTKKELMVKFCIATTNSQKSVRQVKTLVSTHY